MLPKKLIIKNFKGHKETVVDFTQFDSCLILGQYKSNTRKSNATGKTTVYDAISWVLFDETNLKSVKRLVRNGQDICEVIFEFSQDDVDWQIIRKRNTKNSKSVVLSHLVDGKWEKDDQRTSSQMEEDIKDLIKINYKSFTNSVLFAQGSFSEIAEATEGKRRDLFKEPLSLAIYSKYEKSAKLKYSEIEKEYNKTKTIIDTLGNPQEDIKHIDVEMSNIDSFIELLEKNREQLKTILTTNREKYSELEKLLSSDDAKISEKIIEINNQKKKQKESIAKLQQQAVQYGVEINKYNSQIDDLGKSLLLNKKEHTEFLEKKIREEKEIQKDVEEVDEKIKKGNVYIATVQVNYDKWKKALPAGAECEVCFNELNDEYREKVSKENEKKAEEALKQLTSSKKKLATLHSKKSELASEKNSILEHKHHVKQCESNISAIETKIEQNKLYLNKVEELAKKLLLDAEEHKIKLAELEKQEKDLNKKAEKFNFADINNELIKIKQNIKDEEEQDNKLIKEMSANSTQKGILGERKRKREVDSRQLEDLNKQFGTLEKGVKKWNRVVKAFGSSGIPTMIIHTILDDLQIESNKILQDVRPDLSLRFVIEKEDKDILDIVYNDNGVDLEYNQLSGGQKTYISFALRLGMSIVIQKRIGIEIKLLEFDEVDQSLDEEGKDSFVDVIRKYQKKYKILIITHDNRLKDKFNYALVIEKDNGGSVGKVVNI